MTGALETSELNLPSLETWHTHIYYGIFNLQIVLCHECCTPLGTYYILLWFDTTQFWPYHMWGISMALGISKEQGEITQIDLNTNTKYKKIKFKITVTNIYPIIGTLVLSQLMSRWHYPV